MTPPPSSKRSGAPDWLNQKERSNRFWLTMMRSLSLWFGRSLSRIILFGIAFYFVLVGGKTRPASQTYLARVLGRPATFRDRYCHLLTFASTIHDRIYLLRGHLNTFDITFNDADSLLAENSMGRGVLLFGAHLGSFEVLHTLSRHHPKLSVSMAMYSVSTHQTGHVLSSINPDAMQDTIQLGSLDAMLTVHRRLSEGALVGILADRAAGPDQYITLPFLGEPAHFPIGSCRMAIMLGSPVYFMAGLYLGGNRYHIHFEKLTEGGATPKSERKAAVQILLTRYVTALERQCRAAPFNWFNFYDFWKAA